MTVMVPSIPCVSSASPSTDSALCFTFLNTIWLGVCASSETWKVSLSSTPCGIDWGAETSTRRILFGLYITPA